MGEANNPGPPLAGRRFEPNVGDHLNLFFGNLRGLSSDLSVGKWDLFASRAQIRTADVVPVSETHLDLVKAWRFRKAVFGKGFGGFNCSPGQPQTCGTMLAGRQGLLQDPHNWSSDCEGRVGSSVLRRGSSDVLLISVYFPVGHGEAKRRCQNLSEEVAARVLEADVPTVILGDFNSEPWNEELAPLHEICQCAHEV